MMIGFFEFVGDAGERYLRQRPDRVAAVSIKAVTIVRPCRAIFQHRPEIFVDVIDKKDNLGIDSIKIRKNHIRLCDDINNIFIILAQKIRKNFAGFKIFMLIGNDSTIPIMRQQIPVAGALSGGASERFDRRQRQRDLPKRFPELIVRRQEFQELSLDDRENPERPIDEPVFGHHDLARSGLEKRLLLGDQEERLAVTLGSNQYRTFVVLRRQIRLYRARLVNERVPIMVVRHLWQRSGLDPPRSLDGLPFGHRVTPRDGLRLAAAILHAVSNLLNRHIKPCQRPLKRGLRFSLKASTPSRRSAVGTMRLYASISSIMPLARSICIPKWIACLAWRTEIGALSPIRRPVSSASSTTRPGAQRRLTMPHSYASAAVNGRPVRMISLARRSPTARGRCCVPPAPGMMPRVTSVSAKRALSAA